MVEPGGGPAPEPGRDRLGPGGRLRRGIWPATTASFLAPWLGFMDTLVVHRPIRVDGPDPIGSAAYAFDYQEVKKSGGLRVAGP